MNPNLPADSLPSSNLHKTPPKALHPDHRADLEKSGLCGETIRALGIYSACPGDIPKMLGWDPPGVQSLMVFPYPGANGFFRAKVFPPCQDKEGHTIKYLQRRNSGVHLYSPPLASARGKDPTSSLAWTEGERKAAKACQEGIPCVGLGGLWNWLQEGSPIAELETIAHTGREELLLPDSDVWKRPDLLRAVYAFGKEIEGQGAKVEVGIIPPGQNGTKWGLDDFLVHEGAEALREIKRITLNDAAFLQAEKWWQWRKQKEDKLKREKNARMSWREAILDADQLRGMDIPAKKKIIEPWLSEQSLTLIAGWRGIGKTWFTMGLSDAVSRGLNFGPWETVTPVSILYVDGEMPLQDTKERLDALAVSAEGERRERLLLYSDFYGNSLGIPKANLLNVKWRNAIKEIALECGIKLIVLDNLSSLCPGIDENSKFEWDPINQWLLGLRFSGIAGIFLHHTGRGGWQRGTTGREDNLDNSISLSRPPDYLPEYGAKFVVQFKKSRVRASELPLITDTEFYLQEIEGRLIWNWGGVRRKNQLEILRLLNEGMAQSDVAKTLEIDRAYVSRVKTKAIKDGHLSKMGRLTPKGFLLINSEGEDEEES